MRATEVAVQRVQGSAELNMLLMHCRLIIAYLEDDAAKPHHEAVTAGCTVAFDVDQVLQCMGTSKMYTKKRTWLNQCGFGGMTQAHAEVRWALARVLEHADLTEADIPVPHYSTDPASVASDY